MTRWLPFVLILVAVACIADPVYAGEIPYTESLVEEGVYTFEIGSDREVGDTTQPIDFCPTMTIEVNQGSTAAFSIYAATRFEDTLARLRALTPLSEIAEDHPTPISIAAEGSRLVMAVDTKETAGFSTVVQVKCKQRAFGEGFFAQPGEICAGGGVRGGGYNPTTGFYDWTCGNYNFSAEKGGKTLVGANYQPNWDLPTTPGGNSWTMPCTGLRTGSLGTSVEQAVCLAEGEQVKMYSTADLMLAIDQARPGGKIYMPEGLFHFAYCGKDEDGNQNGCPIMRTQDGYFMRKVVLNDNKELIGAGEDMDGPWVNGRTGTWFIVDGGSDNDLDSSFADDNPEWADITGGGIGLSYFPGHWHIHVGEKQNWETCFRPAGSTDCAASADTTNTNGYGQSPIATGYTQIILQDATNWDFGGSQYPELCIRDTIGTVGEGVCSGDLRVQCTANSGGRTGPVSGDCGSIGLGTCIAPYSAFKQANNALPANEIGYLRIPVRGLGEYGTATGITATSQVFYAPIAENGFTDTVCATNGKLIRLGGYDDDNKFGFTNYQAYLTAAHFNTAYWVPSSKLVTPSMGISHLSIMPKDYYGSATCSDGTQSGCDEQELIALSGGVNSFARYLSIWHGVGSATNAYGFSVVDGDPGCLYCELGWSRISRFSSLASDASGWWFHDNLWDQGTTSSGTGSQSVIKAGFGPEMRIERDTFRDMAFENMMAFQNSSGSTIKDIKIENTEAYVAYFRFSGAHNVKIDGMTGSANAGTLFSLESKLNLASSSENLHISNVHMKNHSLSNQGRMHAVWARTTLGGTAGYDDFWAGINSWTDSSIQVHGDEDWCLFFWDGLDGDESDANHGLNNPVDDDRNRFTFRNIAMEVYDDGSKAADQVAFCFGDNLAINDPDNVNMQYLKDVVGALPSWQNILIGNVQIPDNPYLSMTSEEAGDCEDLVYGTTVRVHDADAVGACEDSDNDGVMDPESADNVGLTAVCKCDPTGNAGTGAWSP